MFFFFLEKFTVDWLTHFQMAVFFFLGLEKKNRFFTDRLGFSRKVHKIKLFRKKNAAHFTSFYGRNWTWVAAMANGLSLPTHLLFHKNCVKIKLLSWHMLIKKTWLKGTQEQPYDAKKIYSFRHKINPGRNKINSQGQILTPKAQNSIIRYPPPTSWGPNCFENLKSTPRRPKHDPHSVKIDS